MTKASGKEPKALGSTVHANHLISYEKKIDTTPDVTKPDAVTAIKEGPDCSNKSTYHIHVRKHEDELVDDTE